MGTSLKMLVLKVSARSFRGRLELSESSPFPSFPCRLHRQQGNCSGNKIKFLIFIFICKDLKCFLAAPQQAQLCSLKKTTHTHTHTLLEDDILFFLDKKKNLGLWITKHARERESLKCIL